MSAPALAVMGRRSAWAPRAPARSAVQGLLDGLPRLRGRCLLFEMARGGVGKDEARAAALYGKACDGGAALGCTNLGHLLEEGHGVKKDEGFAARLYGQACERGEYMGCYSLGVLFANLREIGKDNAAAAFARGCALGHQDSCAGARRESAAGLHKARRHGVVRSALTDFSSG